MIRITAQEMHDFSRYIAEISGIAIDEGKKYLLENRLQPILTAQACSSFYELLFSVKNAGNTSLRSKVVDALATNETYFFRDQAPFEILRHKIIPEILDRRKAQILPARPVLRIWCAGCSTGQEVYSVIIALLETVPNIGNYDVRVLGTDISNRVIAQASAGRFSQYEVERGLPAPLLQKYFVAENGGWRVRDEVRALAVFSRMNLLEPFYGIGPFDLVFCRNVSIYFSEQNKVELFRKIARILDRDGYLLVGGSESLNEVAPQFTCHRHLKGMFYRRNDQAATTAAVRKSPPPPQPPPGPAAAGPATATVGGGRNRAGTRAGTAGKPVVPGADQAPARRRDAAGPAAPARDESRPQGTEAAPSARAAAPRAAAAGQGAADEPRPLLASILDRRQGAGPAAWDKRRQGEGQRSLLEVIHDLGTTEAATEKGTEAE